MASNCPINLDVLRIKASNQALVRMQVPEGTKRTPVDISCVVDVSGSMDTSARMQNERGETEDYGMTLLDIVKHAVKTIAQFLGPEDRLSLVTYSTTARTILGLTKMDSQGQIKMTKEVEKLQTEGCTNIWEGLKAGLDILNNDKNGQGRMSSVFILTDGCPNETPPEGNIPALRQYLDQHNPLCSIYTFGFGYSLDSKLLAKIARLGKGIYNFIPDSS